MLLNFAPSGHYFYLKSLLFLQQILKLCNPCPEIFKAFTAVYHVTRDVVDNEGRLWIDLLIEQFLTQSSKIGGPEVAKDKGKDLENIKGIIDNCWWKSHSLDKVPTSL